MSQTMIDQLTEQADLDLERAERRHLSARRRVIAKREARRKPIVRN